MAGNGEVVGNFKINVGANIEQAEQAIKKIQTLLNNTKMNTSATAGMQSELDKVTKQLENFKDQASKPIQTKGQGNQLTQQYQEVLNSLSRVEEKAKSLNIDPGKLLPAGWKNGLKNIYSSYDKIVEKSQEYKSNVDAATAAVKQQKELLAQQAKVNAAKGAVTTAKNNAKQFVKDNASMNMRMNKDETINMNSLKSGTINGYGWDKAKAAQSAYLNGQTYDTKALEAYNEWQKKIAQADQHNLEIRQALNTQSKEEKAFNGAAKGTNFTIDTNFAKNIEDLQAKISGLSDSGSVEFQKLREQFAQLAGIDISKVATDFEGFKAQLEGSTSSKIEEISSSLTNMGNQAAAATGSLSSVGSALNSMNAQLDANNAKLQQVQGLFNRIQYYTSMTGAVMLMRRALQSAISSVKELDEAMTNIAVVTSYSVDDMWAKLPEYEKQASSLGATVKGAYETSTLLYQQGLKTNAVVETSTEIMKMAKIAGLDYADATDTMTTAIRGFGMEMNEVNATLVNDVFSNVARNTASNVEELSTAISKVAALAHNAGMDIQHTTALLATGIETTRESAESIGTALKTVVARFNELTKAPEDIEEVDGEIVNANNVEAALRSAGIALRDVNGQFRDTDDVLFELSEKWNTLDRNTQRYIATQAAGSRQQSRFIAMMSDNARLTEVYSDALNSDGAADEQFEKTLDSLESKLNELSNAWESFLMGIANNEVIKTCVTILTNLLNVINTITGSGDSAYSMFSRLALVIAGLAGAGKLVGAMIAGVKAQFAAAGTEAGNAFVAGFQTRWKSQSVFSALFKKSTISVATLQKSLQSLTLTEKEQSIVTNIETNAQKKGIAVTQQWIAARLEESGTELSLAEQKAALIMIEKSALTAKQKELATNNLLVIANNGLIASDTEHIGAVTAECAAELAKNGIDLQSVSLLSLLTSAKYANVTATNANVVIQQLQKKVTDSVILSKLQEYALDESHNSVILTSLRGIAKKIAAKYAEKVAQKGVNTSTLEGIILAYGMLAVILLIAAAVIALIVGLVALIKWLVKINDATEVLKTAKEDLNDATEGLENAKDALENLTSAQEEYNDTQNKFDELTEGTTEWTQAIIEANQEVLELIQTYSELAKYTSTGEYGQLIITDEGWDKVIAQQQDQVEYAQAAALGRQKDVYVAQRKLDLTETFDTWTSSWNLPDWLDTWADDISLVDLWPTFAEAGGDVSKTIDLLIEEYSMTEDEATKAATALAEYNTNLKSQEQILQSQTQAMYIAAADEENAEYKYLANVAKNRQAVTVENNEEAQKLSDDLWGFNFHSGGGVTNYWGHNGDTTIVSDLLDAAGLDETDMTNNNQDDLAKIYFGLIGESDKVDDQDAIDNFTYSHSKEDITDMIAEAYTQVSENGEFNKLIDAMQQLDETTQKNIAALMDTDTTTQMSRKELEDFSENYAEATEDQFKNYILGLTDENGNAIYDNIDDFLEDYDYDSIADALESYTTAVENCTDKFQSAIDSLNNYGGEGFADENLFGENSNLSSGTTTALSNKLSDLIVREGTDAASSMQQFLSDIYDTIDPDKADNIIGYIAGLDWTDTASWSDLSTQLESLGISLEEIDGLSLDELAIKFNTLNKAISKLSLDDIIDKFKTAEETISSIQDSGTINYEQYKTLDTQTVLNYGIVATGSDTFTITGDIPDLIADIKANTDIIAGQSDYTEEQIAASKKLEDSKDQKEYIIYGTSEDTDASALDLLNKVAGYSASNFDASEQDGMQSGGGDEATQQAIKDTIDETVKYLIGSGIGADLLGEDSYEGLINAANVQGDKRNYAILQAYIAQAQGNYVETSTVQRDKLTSAELSWTNGTGSDFLKEVSQYSKNEENFEATYGVELTDTLNDVSNALMDTTDSATQYYNSIYSAMSKQGIADYKIKAAATDIAKTDDAITSLGETMNDYVDELIDGNTLSTKAIAEMGTAAGSAYEKILSGSSEVASSIVTSNLDLLKTIAKGGTAAVDAYEQLGAKILAAQAAAQGYTSTQIESVNSFATALNNLDLAVGETTTVTDEYMIELANSLTEIGYTMDEIGTILGKAITSVEYDEDGNITALQVTQTDVSSAFTGDTTTDSDEPDTTDYDRFYNLTKAMDKLTTAIDDLADEYEIATEYDEDATIADIGKMTQEEYGALQAQGEGYEKQRQTYLNDSQAIMQEAAAKGYDKYFSIDENGAVTENYAALRGITDSTVKDEVDALIEKAETNEDVIDETNSNIAENTKQQKEVKDRGRDEYIDLFNDVKDALIESRQDVIDNLTDLDESITTAQSNIVSTLQDNLTELRQIRDNTDTEKDISDDEQRLAYLQMDTSGGNDLEIKQLQESIKDQREEYTDTLIDQKIDELEDQNDEASKQRQEQIKIMTSQLEADKTNGVINKQIEALLNSGIDENGKIITGSKLDSIIKDQDSFKEMSEAEATKWGEEFQAQAKKGLAWATSGGSNLADNETVNDAKEEWSGKIDAAVTSIQQSIETISHLDASGNGSEGGDGGSGGSGKTGSTQESLTSEKKFMSNGYNKTKTNAATGETYYSNGDGKWYTANQFDEDGNVIKDQANNYKTSGYLVDPNGFFNKGLISRTYNGTTYYSGTGISGWTDDYSSIRVNSKGLFSSSDSTTLSYDTMSKANTNVTAKTANGYTLYKVGSDWYGASDVVANQKGGWSLKSGVTHYKTGLTGYSASDIGKLHLVPKQDSFGQEIKGWRVLDRLGETKEYWVSKTGYALDGAANKKTQVYVPGSGLSKYEDYKDQQVFVSPGQIYVIGDYDKKTQYLNNARWYNRYKTGGLADFTGPAWLDGTKSKPEMVLNQKDTANFIQLKDILADAMKGGLGDTTNSSTESNTNYDIAINLEGGVSSDYDVEQIASKVQSMIVQSANYRNVNQIKRSK